LAKVFFHERDIKSGLHQRKSLKDFIEKIFRKEGKNLERVDIIFCTDEYLLNLNSKFLDHNYFTDTMTFLLSAPGKEIVGESYLSIDRIRDNSTKLGIPFPTELTRVIIHSCLHLCGYSDKSRPARKKMEGLQEGYLKKWKVSRETSK
jgi:rRNA maturation RNase YbeY